jgi:hypothetical protein
MPYYYTSASQQSTNGTANTDTLLQDWFTQATGQRGVIQKLVAASYMTPADNSIRLQLKGTTAGTVTAGSNFTPTPNIPDAPACAVGSNTLPTISGATYVNPVVQLAFNQRGTAMWAAFNADEGCGMVGAGANNASTSKTILFLDSQSTGTTITVDYTVYHTE